MTSTRRRNPLAKVFAKYVAEGTITEVGPVTSTMLGIRFAPDRPVELPYTPGQHVRVQINDPLSVYGILRPVETLRTYTIWEYAPDAIVLRVHRYEGSSIGLTWAEAARAGDRITFWGPQGDFVTRDAAHHVFVGDETATAAFGPMIRALGRDARITGVLESEAPGDELTVPGGHPLRRVYRRGAPAHYSRTLVAGLERLDLPAEPGAAYVAGEARTCQLVRDHLVERGWNRAAIVTKPFWTPGKRGLH